MSDPTVEFLDALSHRPPDPLVARVRGTVQLELEDGVETDYWAVVLSNGNVSALPGRRPADCVINVRRSLFDEIATGRLAPFAALLRNQLTVSGDLLLYGYFQRLLPGPPGARDPRELVAERGGRR
ncbi:SCP2 sterol-binding domain-containing protein [Solwaraspora sp. WMMD1047]|uniref:SCP2 sterol-binding domain-containing protein n=1 Tax=Solwaraspora sp. WMMD1047 TaxID=3016102 RepID=UPI0024167A28|nr:SCP2 sterol-binding domain-containing protein [Solwaraspora sp. WMMD1047]MDG4829022.1 SCP2 sterol-binding domain-containing protein [Solwaraspora sp. WMMD1047]